ncbi:hypothetical protein N9J12_04310 [Alphaproteobacteria bacterium]|nr:hypothetical protein [Alphaproteobacteria bacterium]
MASSRSATDIIEHVEHMLESLSAPDLSAKCFADECLALEAFLEMHGDSLFRTEKLDEVDRSRVLAVITRLDQLQKRAAVKAAMPSELQKYIADNDDKPA